MLPENLILKRIYSTVGMADLAWYAFLCLMALTNGVQTIFLPDFESAWLPMTSQSTPNNKHIVPHGLGETPLLVDVQVKSTDSPNMDYIFPGVGIFVRDDDSSAPFGGILYLYNENEIILSAPILDDHEAAGSAIFTADSGYYVGPNSQSSHSVLVKVRAWLASSLPSPDFNVNGVTVTARSSNPSDTYIERSHGLGEYPSLVIVKTKLTDGGLPGYMSDAGGSSLVAYGNGGLQQSNSVFYGYNNESIRAWAPSVADGYIFHGKDGYALLALATTGEVEMYVWGSASLQPSLVQLTNIGPNTAGENFQLNWQYSFYRDPLVKVFAESTSGPNVGYRFPGSGATAYSPSTQDVTCTYGGLTYAYNNNTLRLWRPSETINGGVVCVPSLFGAGTNADLTKDVTIVAQLWVLNLNLSRYEDIWYGVDEKCMQTI